MLPQFSLNYFRLLLSLLSQVTQDGHSPPCWCHRLYNPCLHFGLTWHGIRATLAHLRTYYMPGHPGFQMIRSWLHMLAFLGHIPLSLHSRFIRLRLVIVQLYSENHLYSCLPPPLIGLTASSIITPIQRWFFTAHHHIVWLSATGITCQS